MRYRVRGAGIIRSENAAKPPSQKSKFATNLIADMSKVESSLDYGAGKLRYLEEVLQTTDRLTVVDSSIQLERRQRVFGERRSVRDTIAESNTIDVLTTKELLDRREDFDRAFLMNVLQIIPISAVRSAVLTRVHRSLKVGGQIVICVQYRNSEFTRMLSMSNARKFRDGMLIKHIRGTSFYAFIQPPHLSALVEKSGFRVETTKLNDGSCYLIATKADAHS